KLRLKVNSKKDLEKKFFNFGKRLKSSIKVLITSSHRPTRLIRSFMNDLASIIPNSTRVNRGKMSFMDVAKKALALNINLVLIVRRWKGGPGKIEFYGFEDKKMKLLPPIIYVKGVRLRRNHKILFRAFKVKPRSLSIIKPLNNDSETQKIAETLAKILKVPVASSVEDAISDVFMKIYRNNGGNLKVTFISNIHGGVEVGPEIFIKHIIWG
ncbi:MAG: hypothetical protein N3E48_04275, partial [Candidatus Bathyarchaeota archaeon]|nr:hypothetical protein [Candidatus Bathyarchaeota archaeon]